MRAYPFPFSTEREQPSSAGRTHDRRYRARVRVEDAIRGYLEVAFRLDRLLPGAVDAYGRSAVLHEQVRRGPRPVPSDLVRAAGSLAAALPADLEAERACFLRGQLVACEWTARRLAGQAVPFVDEVAAAFGVRIAVGSEEAYRAAHRELDAVLPGSGTLAERMADHRRGDEVPRERLGVAVRAVSEALRARMLPMVPLDASESVAYRLVDDAPWSALHRYEGGFRSRITINAGARVRRAQLPQLLAHEVYPGHHTERCRKEAGLVARGWAEHAVVLANTPQSLVAEGAGELGLRAVVGPGWGRWSADVLAGVGLPFDGELAERVAAATSVLARVRQDAALMLHDRRVPAGLVATYMRRWLLLDDEGAGRVIRFLRHPLWRAYTTAYVEGSALLHRWWEQDPGPDRFRRLLDEPLTPSVLRADISSVRPGGRPPNGSH